MPDQDDALYTRGRYRLAYDQRRDGSLRTPFLQIVWYDATARRLTSTENVQQAENELDFLDNAAAARGDVSDAGKM